MEKASGANRIRIAVDLTSLLPGGANGGVKPAIFEFIRALQNFSNPSFHFSFVTAISTHSEVESIMTARDRAFCLDSIIAQGSLPLRFFRENEIDLLYAPFGMVRFPRCEVPIISMVVDVLHRDYPHTLTEKERRWRETYFSTMVRFADRFQVISDYTGERLAHHYGVPAERIFRTYLPIQDRLKIQDRTKKSSNNFFLYPANFWQHKNHEILLIAYQLYRSGARTQPWDLVLTGCEDESRRPMLRNLVMSLGIEPHVLFKGYVTEMELGQLYSEASALIFPSLHEGFGIPAIEAMRAGLPILASGICSLREIAGPAALLADARKPLELAAAMEKLASSGELQADLRRRGLERSKSFSLKGEVARLAEAFVQTSATPRKIEWTERLRRHLESARDHGVDWSRAVADQVSHSLLHRV
jgi:glycosyltransferase involved in cell wall biosynthesis